VSYAIDFINKVKDGALATQKKYNILSSITISQAILESGFGKSKLALECNNLFGIKAIGAWMGEKKLYKTYEYYNGHKILVNDYFRVYKSYSESIEDHALFLVNNCRYRQNGLFSAKDYIGQAKALLRAGYATSPSYANQLIQIIRQYNLQRFDCLGDNCYINVEGIGHTSYKGGAPGIELIIKDYGKDVYRVFAWVDNDEKASWAFALTLPNDNYTLLRKNANKVITKRNGGYSFSKGAIYKIKIRAYSNRGKVIGENQVVVKIQG